MTAGLWDAWDHHDHCDLDNPHDATNFKSSTGINSRPAAEPPEELRGKDVIISLESVELNG